MTKIFYTCRDRNKQLFYFGLGWRAELYKPTKRSREFDRATKKPDYSNKEHEQRKSNESSTKQVELSYLKEEIKDIKRTLDILLKSQ